MYISVIPSTGPFEKLTQVTMILPLTGKQYSEKVSEMCVGVWKSNGTYTDADAITIDKFLEVFKDQNFPPDSSILFTTSSIGSLSVIFYFHIFNSPINEAKLKLQPYFCLNTDQLLERWQYT